MITRQTFLNAVAETQAATRQWETDNFNARPR
jgi:hypothetical protein